MFITALSSSPIKIYSVSFCNWGDYNFSDSLIVNEPIISDYDMEVVEEENKRINTSLQERKLDYYNSRKWGWPDTVRIFYDQDIDEISDTLFVLYTTKKELKSDSYPFKKTGSNSMLILIDLDQIISINQEYRNLEIELFNDSLYLELDNSNRSLLYKNDYNDNGFPNYYGKAFYTNKYNKIDFFGKSFYNIFEYYQISMISGDYHEFLIWFDTNYNIRRFEILSENNGVGIIIFE